MKKLLIFLTASFTFILGVITAVAATQFSDGVYTFEKNAYGNAVVTDCNLTDDEVNVPTFVLDTPVVGIGDYAFFSNSYVKSVTLPDTVISIGEYAFAENPNLQSVFIPRWCETIADNAFWHSENVKIICYKDTYAQTYAKENGIAYKLLDLVYIIGDTDLDGEITISDVTQIQRHLALIEEFTEEQLAAADTNGDGHIDINDVTHLQKYIAKYEGIVLGEQ